MFPATLCASTIERKTKKQPEKSFRLRVVDGQDSPISGAERTFEPVADTDNKKNQSANGADW